jgi:F0F1-type ATP synthase delta subunit
VFLSVQAQEPRQGGTLRIAFASIQQLDPYKSANNDEIHAFYDARLPAEVVSARELSASQTTALETALRNVVGGKVALSIRVDPGLIGGLVVKVGSRMVDSSLKTQLQRLQIAMKGAS